MACHRTVLLFLTVLGLWGCGDAPEMLNEVEPKGLGPFPVGSTNLEVAAGFQDIGDEAMHALLLGTPDESDNPRFVADILKYPEAAWVVEVLVPTEPGIYGPAAGLTLPVVTFVTYPSTSTDQPSPYTFPYHDGAYGTFENMLAPGDLPTFADPEQRYPLIILSHGASAHGIYDIAHAHDLSRHGYIVAVINYGDERTLIPDDPNAHSAFLRPLLTKAVIDSLIESDTFAQHIDTDNIGVSGHSFGGFTALAIAGGLYQGNPATVSDERVKAGVIAAPWVGGNYDGDDVFGFGPDNIYLSRINVPIISFFGTNDDVTTAEFILPAMKKLSGPTYLIELVDQPHVFEGGSWEDRNAWELLFFDAYLKKDSEALDVLKTSRSMRGGNEDNQLFEYQK
ncbi:MAG: hypothetical protein QNJ11_11740 [Woeseiaceae bacterium]|nr:hypothetical protein [Woeseiaceae bacterium]